MAWLRSPCRRFGPVAARGEVAGQFVHHDLGRAKDDAQFHVLQVEQPAEHFELRAAVHLVIDLLDGRHRERLRLDAHLHRVARETADHVPDRRRHRGRKEHRLPLGRGLGKDFFDVLAETHVEHPVGLVEHDRRDLLERERAAFQVVHDATRRADDDLRAVAQAAQLPVVRRAAVDGQFAHALS